MRIDAQAGLTPAETHTDISDKATWMETATTVVLTTVAVLIVSSIAVLMSLS